jgi:hypothetical protein
MHKQSNKFFEVYFVVCRIRKRIVLYFIYYGEYELSMCDLYLLFCLNQDSVSFIIFQIVSTWNL